MKTVCELNKCTGCMACIDICPKKAIKMKDDLDMYNAVIQEDKCNGCNACHNVCQNNQPAKVMPPREWYQAWTKDSKLRQKCSSGGLATAISEAFIDTGGVVYGCTFKNGGFFFDRAENRKDLKKYTGSKYVKSNPVGIYNIIKERLKKGEKILFIGLPCQASAMRNFIGKNLEQNLYIIDLICHGTPSPKILEIFLKQYGFTLAELKDIQFRNKAKFMIYVNSKTIITQGVTDKYSIAFLNSLIYTKNCYTCPYARKERVSDLTLGDSWGSKLPVEEQKKGISLILCQNDRGKELLELADVCLHTVDLNVAIKNNHQLEFPSCEPKGREKFFREINDKKFNSLVLRQLPKQCFRQDLKERLIKLGVWK